MASVTGDGIDCVVIARPRAENARSSELIAKSARAVWMGSSYGGLELKCLWRSVFGTRKKRLVQSHKVGNAKISAMESHAPTQIAPLDSHPLPWPNTHGRLGVPRW
jgi:hypothetical protein